MWILKVHLKHCPHIFPDLRSLNLHSAVSPLPPLQNHALYSSVICERHKAPQRQLVYPGSFQSTLLFVELNWLNACVLGLSYSYHESFMVPFGNQWSLDRLPAPVLLHIVPRLLWSHSSVYSIGLYECHVMNLRWVSASLRSYDSPSDHTFCPSPQP